MDINFLDDLKKSLPDLKSDQYCDNLNGKVDIFDFNMNRVTSFDCNRHPDIDDGLYCFWDGLNDNKHTVANGVYFCRLSLKGKYYWTKLAVINSY